MALLCQVKEVHMTDRLVTTIFELPENTMMVKLCNYISGY